MTWTPQTLVATTIGRVAIPKLADTLVRTGADKFVKVYGQKAFEAVLGTAIGARAYSKTEEYITEYLNHIDSGEDENSFVPKGSMPTATRLEQMDAMMAVPSTKDDTTHKSVPVATGQGDYIGDTGQKERERERIAAKEKERMKGAPAPKVETGWKESFPDQLGELIDSSPPNIPEPIITSNVESFPDLSEEANKPIIYYNEKVGKKMLTKESTDYRLQHKPRGPDDEYPVRLDDLTQTTTGESAGYPKDFYSEKGKRIYAPGQSFEGDEFGIANNESYSIINSVRGNPDAEVTIYRAVPNEKNITKINSGDFVTLSKRYADLHGAGGYGRDGTDSGKVLELKVKVKDIYWDQNDVNEFGYFPEKNKDDVSKQTEDLVRGIGDNNPPSSIKEETTENITQDNFVTKDNVSVTNNLKTQNFLDDKLMDDLLVIRGGIEGYKKNMASDFPKMPDSTKAKMEIELQKKLFDKYKLNDYPEGETPDTVTEERKEYLINTYHKRVAAIEYITSVAYDVIGTKDKDSILVVDEDGLPLSAAKIAVPGNTKVNVSDIYHKDALVIVEMGSIFRNAGDQLVNDIIQKAKDENRRFVVAEDLTSEGALQAMKDRGFRTTTTKDTKKFKGKKIRRPNGRSAVQKNLVLDLSKEIIKEQTDNLLKKK